MPQNSHLIPTLLLVAAGGAIGAVARFLLAGWLNGRGGGFPVGTLTVNVVGCLLIGFLTVVLRTAWPAGEAVRMGLIVGMLGGFTTFSAFGLETLALLQNDSPGRAALYVLASNGLGVAAAWAGWSLASLLPAFPASPG